MIFKIQRPLYSTKGEPYLIYNQDRTIQTLSLEIGMLPELDNLFKKGEAKIYAKGYIDKKGRLVLNKRVEEQEW